MNGVPFYSAFNVQSIRVFLCVCLCVWRLEAQGMHKVTSCNRLHIRYLLGEGYTKAASEQGWRRERAGCEGTGAIKGYRACTQGEYATLGNSGNVLHLLAVMIWYSAAEGRLEAHLVLECGWSSIFQQSLCRKKIHEPSSFSLIICLYSFYSAFFQTLHFF